MTEEYIRKKDLEDFAMDCVCGVVNIEQIHNFPAADVVPVVRCADCKWIPVEARMPEEPFGCLLIVDDTDPYTGRDFLNYLPYFAGWDGEQWNDDDGQQVPFEVRYWMPLPPIPKEET